MAKRKVNKIEKITYDYTVRPVSQTFEIARGKYSLKLKVSAEHIEIDNEFVFKSSNSKETITRWENVVGLIMTAIQVAKDNVKEAPKKVTSKSKKKQKKAKK